MMHPAVQRAIDAIQRQFELVRLDFPELPPCAQMQIARSRCPDEIMAANGALDFASVHHLPTAPGAEQRQQPRSAL